MKQYGEWCPIESINNLERMVEVDDAIISPGHVLIKKRSIPEEWMNIVLKHQGCDDYLLWIMMLGSGCRFKFNPEQLFTHVVHDGNTSKNIVSMFESQNEVLAVALQKGFIQEKSYKIRIERDNHIREKFSYKYQEIAELYGIWMHKIIKGCIIEKYINSIGIKEVIIYGWGMLGRELYLQLRDSSCVSVRYIIDRNYVKYIGEMDFCSIERVLSEKIRKEDTLIIVTMLGIADDVSRQLRDEYDLRTLTIHELICNL